MNDRSIVTALVAGMIASGHIASVRPDVISYSEISDHAEQLVAEVLRRSNDDEDAQ